MKRRVLTHNQVGAAAVNAHMVKIALPKPNKTSRSSLVDASLKALPLPKQKLTHKIKSFLKGIVRWKSN